MGSLLLPATQRELIQDQITLQAQKNMDAAKGALGATMKDVEKVINPSPQDTPESKDSGGRS